MDDIIQFLKFGTIWVTGGILISQAIRFAASHPDHAHGALIGIFLGLVAMVVAICVVEAG